MTDKYCDPHIWKLRWKYCLVVSDEDYYAECQNLGIKRDDWGTPTAGSSACCTFFMPPASDEKVCIVAITDYMSKSGIQVAGLLCHEAAHIFQREMLDVGEGKPSDEFMAYTIQWIAQELMEQFCRQVVKKLITKPSAIDAWPFEGATK